MTIKIITDCAADLFPEEREALDITEAPLYIQFPDGEVDARAISPDEFYTKLATIYPAIPSTAQPSSGMFSELYKKVAETADEILAIYISSGLSGTINSARNGAAALKDKAIRIVDSMTLSGGQRFQVVAAALAARANWSMDEILARLDAIRAQTEVIYTLETLEYLIKGGRIGRVQALAGSLLKIKPVIHVSHKDGKYESVGKNRTINRNLDLIVKHLQNIYGDTPMWTMVVHGQFQEAANNLAAKLQEGLNVAKMEIGRISPVLGVHTGPSIVGVTAVPIALFDGLI